MDASRRRYLASKFYYEEDTDIHQHSSLSKEVIS